MFMVQNLRISGNLIFLEKRETKCGFLIDVEE